MTTPPTPPTPGKPISASFFARLIAWAKSGMLIEGTGYRLRRGPNGTALEIDVAKSARLITVLPWSFSCTETDDPEKPGEKKRTGGWRNCRLQIGYNGWLVSPDLNTPDMLAGAALIEGTDRTDDGAYVVEVDVSKDTAKIMLRSEVSHIHPVDPEASVVYIDIGYVKDGVQKTRIPTNPVVYKYV